MPWDKLNRHATVFILLFIIIRAKSEMGQERGKISKEILGNLASKFGEQLFEFGQSVTNYNELQRRFQTSVNSDVKEIELKKLIVEITNEMNIAIKGRVEAVRKIMVWAEEKASEYYETPPESRAPPPETYVNAKKIHDIELTYDDHFNTEVNTDFSAVHVPSTIYEKREDLLEPIGWSTNIDNVFISNYRTNPTLSWQFFGSSTGFLRQYPAMKWPNENRDRENPDIYDCRTRPWFVTAANSAKNIIILQDISGSMTGLRGEITKLIVSNILDTLTENDFVNVYNFSDECTPLVPCYKDRLVQANLETIREFKDGLGQHHRAGLANFSAAINTAFDILEKQFSDSESSECNQAIMIITDLVPYTYEEIFEVRQKPGQMVRVFTYVVGRDATDTQGALHMACANNGYYTHVPTLSEVQAQVLKYIPVMSRPKVMHQRHEVTWTNVYVDIDEVYETDWLWQEHNLQRQFRRSEKYKEFLRQNFDGEFFEEDYLDLKTEISKVNAFLDDEDDNEENLENPGNSSTSDEASKSPKKDYRFVVSASIPVFDKRNSTSDGNRIAILLGVAGTDMAINDLTKIASPFKLGVNGYAYMTNNNGFIVFHPYWRPLFRQELLKLNYNTVDLTEVELADNDNTFNNNDSVLLEMRQEMIELDRGSKIMRIRVHQDDFKRVTIRSQKYEYMKVKMTPYTLGLSVPSNMNRFEGEMELDQGENIAKFFDQPNEPRKWTIHPDWTYCEYVRSGKVTKGTKEDLLLHFLERIRKVKKSLVWKNTVYSCEKELVKSLLFDANVTEVFAEKKLFFALMPRKLIELNGARMAFIATRSGLTRWIDFENTSDNDFIKRNNKATEELWYKRAVERYQVDPDSFVFSVPFNAGKHNDNDIRVTATRAIYVKKNNLEAPVAVVGVQFNHSEWANRLFEIPLSCEETQKGTSSKFADGSQFRNLSKTTHFEFTNQGIKIIYENSNTDGSCKKICESSEYDCFLLDDNGFILISENHKEIGRFYGEIDEFGMESLVKSGVYLRVRIVDFQAVCIEPVSKSNFGNFLRTPLDHLHNLFTWLLGHLAWLALKMNLHSFINPDYSSVLAKIGSKDEHVSDTLHPFLELASIKKTRLRPCHKETFLYTYGPSYNTHNFSYQGVLPKCGHTGCDSYLNVHFIPHSNLILVVTSANCRCGLNLGINLRAKEVNYFPESANLAGDGDESAQVCQPQRLNLFRKRPESCFNYNANEINLKEDCGGKGRMLQSLRMFQILLNMIVTLIGGRIWI